MTETSLLAGKTRSSLKRIVNRKFCLLEIFVDFLQNRRYASLGAYLMW